MHVAAFASSAYNDAAEAKQNSALTYESASFALGCRLSVSASKWKRTWL